MSPIKGKKRKNQKKLSLSESLNDGESAIVLRRLIDAHPELKPEAEEIAKALLRDEHFEDTAEDVYDSIHVLGYDELNGRAGRREWGYVEPGDAASEILTETVEPFLDDLKRRVDLGLEDEALELCKGLVLGFYRLDQDKGGELLQWAPEFAVETAGFVLEIWSEQFKRGQARQRQSVRKKPAGLPKDFVEQFVPDWEEMIVRVVSRPLRNG